jgi:hypothetical protein
MFGEPTLTFLLKRFGTFFLVFLFFCLPVLCQFSDSEAEEETPALKITEPILLDGKLDENVWKNAPEANSLLYIHSDRTDASDVKTSVKILYDASHIYIGFSCFDSNPDLIRGEMTIKDADLRTDDSVYILLETISDKNDYYFFGTNIMGALLDAKISKDGTKIDTGWDGSWNTASALEENRWCAEISINLTDLGYEEGADINIGISLSRVVPRLDSLLWAGPLDPIFNLDEPQIKSIFLLAKWKAFSFNPYILPGYITGEKTGFKEAGFDASFSPHKNFSSSVTVNPDFATVEPVDEKINLTMFELKLADKRPFFFKNIKPFDENFSLFYPLRIGDLYGGLKFQGKAGPIEFSGISTQTKKDEEIQSANFSFLNVSAQPINSFTVSLTASNKILEKQSNGAAAVSMEWKPTQTTTLGGQFLLSYGDFSENRSASFLRLYFDPPSFYFHLDLKRIEKNFWENANQVGYIVDDDRQEIEASLGKSFPLNVMGISVIDYDSYYDVYWSTDSNLRSWEIDQKLSFHFRSFWKISLLQSWDYKFNNLFPEGIAEHGDTLLTEEWEAYRLSLGTLPYFDQDYVFNLLNPTTGMFYKIYSGDREYHGHLTQLTSGFYKGKGNTFFLSIGWGKFFAHVFSCYEAYKDFIISNKFLLGIRANFIRYKYDILPAYTSTRIYILEGTYDIDRNRNFRIYFQHNSALKKLNLYLNYHWIIIPSGGVLDLVYTRDLSGIGEEGNNDQAVYTKFTYSF